MTKRIVLLDSHTTNPGDLSWQPIASLGDLTIYDQTTQEQVIERCAEAEIIITNKLRFRKEEFSNLPNLKLICMLATGYDKIDLVAARAANVTVCNAPHYSSESVAQHVYAMLLHHINMIGEHNTFVQDGKWAEQAWSYTIEPIQSLSGKTMGIFGYGAIGKKVAEIGRAFGMRILAHNRSQSDPSVTFVTPEALCKQSDIISIHTPYTPATDKIINADLLQLMKENAILINTARGGIINERDLTDHLAAHPTFMALLDVLSIEPSGQEHPLVGLENCIVTPHIAWANVQSRLNLIQIVADNIKGYLEGKEQNVVS